MSTTAKLTYVNARGYAEIARLIMGATGVEFTEEFLNSREDFLRLVDSGVLPFQQVPMLEIDGLRLVQSAAISRYLARRAGILGQSKEEEAKVDVYFTGTRDFSSVLTKVRFVDDSLPDAKASLSRYLPAFEKLLTSSGTGHLVGKSLTLADLGLLETLLLVEDIFGPDALNDYPKLKKFHSAMKSDPKIDAFLEGPQRKPMMTPENKIRIKKIFNYA